MFPTNSKGKYSPSFKLFVDNLIETNIIFNEEKSKLKPS